MIFIVVENYFTESKIKNKSPEPENCRFEQTRQGNASFIRNLGLSIPTIHPLYSKKGASGAPGKLGVGVFRNYEAGHVMYEMKQ